MILSFINIRRVPINIRRVPINIRRVPLEVLKMEGKALSFQHFPLDLANVNEWKIIFDPSIMKIGGSV